jgi:hypothetical protein
MCERLAAGNCSTGLGSKRLFERCCPLAARETDAWRHRQARDGWRVEQPDSEIPRMARHEAVRRDLCDTQGDAFFVASQQRTGRCA